MFAISEGLKKTFSKHPTPKDIIEWGDQHRVLGKKLMDLVNIYSLLQNFTIEHWQALANAIKISKVRAVNMSCSGLGCLSETQWNYFCNSLEGIGQVVKNMAFDDNLFKNLKPGQLRMFKQVISGVTLLYFRHNDLGHFSSDQLDAWGEAIQGVKEIDLVGNSFHQFSSMNMKKIGNIFNKAGVRSINIFNYEFNDEHMTNEIWENFCNMISETSIEEVLAITYSAPYGNDKTQIPKKYLKAEREPYQPDRVIQICENNNRREKRRASLTFLSGSNEKNVNTCLHQFFKWDSNYRLAKSILEFAELPIPKKL